MPSPYLFACGICGHEPRDQEEHGRHLISEHAGALVDANMIIPSDSGHEELESMEVFPK